MRTFAPGTLVILLAASLAMAGPAEGQTSRPAADAPPAGTIQVTEPAISWVKTGPTLPAGTEMAILEGDPRKAGMFTIRLRVPAGARIAPHWHPRDERVTVLSGLVRVGFGETFDERRMTPFPAGSFYVNPPQSRHYLLFDDQTILQLTGEGPWELHYLEK